MIDDPDFVVMPEHMAHTRRQLLSICERLEDKFDDRRDADSYDIYWAAAYLRHFISEECAFLRGSRDNPALLASSPLYQNLPEPQFA